MIFDGLSAGQGRLVFICVKSLIIFESRRILWHYGGREAVSIPHTQTRIKQLVWWRCGCNLCVYSCVKNVTSERIFHSGYFTWPDLLYQK